MMDFISKYNKILERRPIFLKRKLNNLNLKNVLILFNKKWSFLGRFPL